MDAKSTADVIISCVKKSNLNYQIQESPFSLHINLRKTFVRNKNGDELLPSSDIFIGVDTLKHKVKIENLEEEKISLRSTVNRLEAELQDSDVAVHEVGIKLEKAKKEVADALFEKNSLLKDNKKLEQKVKEMETDNKTTKSEYKDLKNEIENLKSNVRTANKGIKSGDKEIIRLQNKNDNFEESVKNYKIENKKLIEEKKKVAKEKIQLEKQL